MAKRKRLRSVRLRRAKSAQVQGVKAALNGYRLVHGYELKHRKREPRMCPYKKGRRHPCWRQGTSKCPSHRLR